MIQDSPYHHRAYKNLRLNLFKNCKNCKNYFGIEHFDLRIEYAAKLIFWLILKFDSKYYEEKKGHLGINHCIYNIIISENIV